MLEDDPARRSATAVQSVAAASSEAAEEPIARATGGMEIGAPTGGIGMAIGGIDIGARVVGDGGSGIVGHSVPSPSASTVRLLLPPLSCSSLESLFRMSWLFLSVLYE